MGFAFAVGIIPIESIEGMGFSGGLSDAPVYSQLKGSDNSGN
jgi:hypothetical protein